MEFTLLTLDELANFLKVSPHTIYYWVSRYEIPYVKMGRHLRFNPQDVMQHFNRKTEEKRPPCLAPRPLVQSLMHGNSSRSSLKTRDRKLAETEKE